MKHVTQAKQDILWDSPGSGDRNALSQLYDMFAADLYRYGYNLVRNKPLVEDSLYELFMHLHENRQRLGFIDNIRLYLFQSLRQRLLDAETRLNMGDLETSFSSKPERLILPRTNLRSSVVKRVSKRVYNSIILALTILSVCILLNEPLYLPANALICHSQKIT